MSRFAGLTVALSPEVLFQEVEGEAVLLDLASGQYFGLNPVGTEFWRAAQDTCGVEAIVERLAAGFEVGREELEADLAEFLDDLVDAGLLRLDRDGDEPVD